MADAAHDPSVTTDDLDAADRLGTRLGRPPTAPARSGLRWDPDVPERPAPGRPARAPDESQRTGKPTGRRDLRLAGLLSARPERDRRTLAGPLGRMISSVETTTA
jgi:hypothetical protein